MCWRCYQGGKAWGRNLTPQLTSWQCQEIIPVNLGATLSQRAGRKVCSIPCTEHPLPKQWGVQGGVWPSTALDCSPQESPRPAARQSFDLNHKGCCFHKTCWQNRGDRRGSEKGKKKRQFKAAEATKMCFKLLQQGALVLELRGIQRWLAIAEDKY